MSDKRYQVIAPTHAAVNIWAAQHEVPRSRVTPIVTPAQLDSLTKDEVRLYWPPGTVDRLHMMDEVLDRVSAGAFCLTQCSDSHL